MKHSPEWRKTKRRMATDPAYRRKKLDRVCASALKRRKADKLAVFTFYGRACSICSESDLDVLTIDHPGGDGAGHRKELCPSNHRSGGSSKTYRWLVKNNFPSGFRTLCFNCNIKEHRKTQRSLGVEK